ncbi:MAG: 50S ribosomal protein L30 [Candidatus Hydrothermarchaeota archaeon]
MLAVVRVRGSVNVNRKIKDTLNMLRLTRVNHAVIVRNDENYKGMLQKAKDYITWGEIEKEILAKMIRKRGRLLGDKKITDDYVKEHLGYENIEEFSEAIIKEEVKLTDLPNIKPVFRLRPPKKGYEGVKRPFGNGGSLGYRGKEINSLLLRMI